MLIRIKFSQYCNSDFTGLALLAFDKYNNNYTNYNIEHCFRITIIVSYVQKTSTNTPQMA